MAVPFKIRYRALDEERERLAIVYAYDYNHAWYLFYLNKNLSAQILSADLDEEQAAIDLELFTAYRKKFPNGCFRSAAAAEDMPCPPYMFVCNDAPTRVKCFDKAGVRYIWSHLVHDSWFMMMNNREKAVYKSMYVHQDDLTKVKKCVADDPIRSGLVQDTIRLHKALKKYWDKVAKEETNNEDDVGDDEY